MFEKAYEKAQGMIELLNHTLSLFEKDYEQIKSRYKEEVDKFEKDLNEKKEQLSNLLRDHQILLTKLTKEELNDFFDGLNSKIDLIYKDIREKIEKDNIKKVFEQHSDILTPLIMKSIFTYIFKLKFLRKKP